MNTSPTKHWIIINSLTECEQERKKMIPTISQLLCFSLFEYLQSGIPKRTRKSHIKNEWILTLCVFWTMISERLVAYDSNSMEWIIIASGLYVYIGDLTVLVKSSIGTHRTAFYLSSIDGDTVHYTIIFARIRSHHHLKHSYVYTYIF